MIKHGHAIATAMTVVGIVLLRWSRGLECQKGTLSGPVKNPTRMKVPKAFSGTFAGRVDHLLDLRPITIQAVCTYMLPRSKDRKTSSRLFTSISKASCLGCKWQMISKLLRAPCYIHPKTQTDTSSRQAAWFPNGSSGQGQSVHPSSKITHAANVRKAGCNCSILYRG